MEALEYVSHDWHGTEWNEDETLEAIIRRKSNKFKCKECDYKG